MNQKNKKILNNSIVVSLFGIFVVFVGIIIFDGIMMIDNDLYLRYLSEKYSCDELERKILQYNGLILRSAPWYLTEAYEEKCT